MPSGGARANSGPKRGPDGRALNPYKRRANSKSSNNASMPAADAKVVSAAPPQRMFSDESVRAIIDAMREMKSRGRNRQRTPEWNPYLINETRIGPAAVDIKKNRPKLAMDDNTGLMSANQFAVQAWQAGGLMPNDASEGMLFLGYPYLSQLAQRPEFRLFGEIMSEEMTRKWIDFRGTDDESTKEEEKPKDRNGDDDDADQRRAATDEQPRSDGRNKDIEAKIKELKDYAESLKLRQNFKTIAAQDSFFGISHLHLDMFGADTAVLRDPESKTSIGNGRDSVSVNKLAKGCLRALNVIEPIWCYPTGYNAANPLAPHWYDPEVWYVMGAEIHKTRLLPFIGRPVPDILKPAYAFGGLAMTQMAQPYVDIWLRTRESVGELIHAFSVMVLQTNMATTTQPGGSGGGGGDVLARLALFNMLRDNQGIFAIDKATEDFKNIAAPLSGLDDLQAQSQEHMFSVGRIPGVKFAGITPKGLNASSEGELRAFNDTVHGQQEHLYRTHLTTVLDIMQISLWGARDPDITYDFLPLHEETPKEKAEIRKLEAETDQIRVDSGVVSQEEARTKLASDPDSGYDGIDPDDVPDLIEEEESGLIPKGGGSGVAALAGGGENQQAQQPQRAPGTRREKADRPEADGAEEGDDEDGSADAAIPAFIPRRMPAGAMDEWNESAHPRADNGQFGSGGSGASTTSKNERKPSAELEAAATKAKVPHALSSAQEVRKGFDTADKRASAVVKHIRSLHDRRDQILEVDRPDIFSSMDDMSPDEEVSSSDDAEFDLIIDNAKDVAKGKVSEEEISPDLGDASEEWNALSDEERQEYTMISERLKGLYAVAKTRAKDLAASTAAYKKSLDGVSSRVEKMIESMEDVPRIEWEPWMIAADVIHGESTVGTAKNFLDFLTGAEMSQSAIDDVDETVENFKAEEWWDALPKEEQDKIIQKQEEKAAEEDRKKTEAVHADVDKAIAGGWWPELKNGELRIGRNVPEELAKYASPASVKKIMNRVAQHLMGEVKKDNATEATE